MMNLTDERRKAVIARTFALLKGRTDDEALEAVACLLVKMFHLDTEAMAAMWKEALESAGEPLLWSVMTACRHHTRTYRLVQIVLQDPYLKDRIFASAPEPRTACYIVRFLVERGALDAADACLQTLHASRCRTDGWYAVMDRILETPLKNMTAERLDLLEKWCAKAGTDEERARLGMRLVASIS